MSKETYHVAAILDSYHVIIAAGSNYDLSVGTKIEIFVEGDEILDPISGESLGRINMVKETLEIVQIDQKYSICQKIVEEERTIPGPLSSIGSLARMGDRTVTERRVVQMNVDETNMLESAIKLPSERKKIFIGDKARIPY